MWRSTRMRLFIVWLIVMQLPVTSVGGVGGAGAARAASVEELRSVYVFGTETPIPDLEIWQASTGEQLSYTAVPSGGKGYVRYDFEIPPTACFSLESANHHFTTKDFCAGNGPAFVTHASDTEFLINLFGYEYGMVEGEILSGAMVMIGPGGYRYVGLAERTKNPIITRV